MSKYTTMNGAKMAFSIPMKMKRLLSLRTRVNRDCGMAFADLLTRQSTPFDSCSLKTLSSLVPFCQTGIPSDKSGDSIQGNA